MNRVSSRSSKLDLAKVDVEVAEQPVQLPIAPETDSVTAPPAPAPDASSAELQPSGDARPSISIYSSDDPQGGQVDDAPASSAALSTVPPTQVSHDPDTELKRATDAPPALKTRRLSWRPLSFKFLNSQEAGDEHKPALSLEKEQKKRVQVAEDRTKRAVRVSNADRKAKESAVIVRSLIVGTTGIVLSDAKAKPVSKPKIEKVKSELLSPKTANRVIAQLRALPSYAETLPTQENGEQHTTLAPSVPIHAVCLPFTDSEAHEKHFSRLAVVNGNASAATQLPSVYTASLKQLQAVFADIDAVSLLTAPNFGLGAAADEPGILSGALPTAKTIIDGVEQITPQLLALGYATGKSILPDHTGESFVTLLQD